MKFRLILTLSTILIAHAGTSASSRELTLDAAIEIAMKQNKDVAVARLAVQKADAQVTEAVGSALPALNVGAGYTHNIQLPVFFFPDAQTGAITPIRFGLANSYNVSAQIQQIIFNGAVFTGIGASRIYVDAAKAQLDATIAEVVTETKKRYYMALSAKEFVTVAQATLTNALETQRTIDALFNEGLIAEFDKIRAEVAVANIQPTVIDAQSSQYNAIGALQTYLALGSEDSISVTGEGFDIPISAPDENSMIALAMKENYDLIALTLQVEVSKEIVDIHVSDYYPTLSAFGQWQNQGVAASFDNWFSASSTAVGLNFSFNIFNGFRTKSKIEQASVDHLSAKKRLEQLTDLIKLHVKTIVNQLKSAKSRIDAQRSTVSQAQRGLAIAKIRYNEGAGNLLEINDAETALARSKVNELNALYDYRVTRAELDRVTGQIDAKYRRLGQS